jgi:hypothetical protein
LTEDDEAIDQTQHLVLCRLVVGNQVRHAEHRSHLPRQSTDDRSDRWRHQRSADSDRHGDTAVLQLAGGAFHRPHETVAQLRAPAHHRSALAREPEAGRMCRRDHLRADLFRCADFREAEPRHIGVDVHDIRRRTTKPLVKQFGAANDDASLEPRRA